MIRKFSVSEALTLVRRHDTREERTEEVNRLIRPVGGRTPDKDDLAWNVAFIVALRQACLWPDLPKGGNK